jgi:hypothetical protein
MKLPFTLSLFISGLLFSGCAFPQQNLVLDPVGPPSVRQAAADSEGSLLVFSAFDPQPHFSDLPDKGHYTDYKIFTEDGRLLQQIHNDNGGSLEGPLEVKMEPGKYRVLARANGYGLVTVPVVVLARQTTIVHLEGGTAWPHQPKMTWGDAVRLPNGEVVGWRNEPVSTAKQ